MKNFLTEVTTKYSDIVDEIDAYELFDQTNIAASSAEAHFGIMFDFGHPKKTLDVFASFAAHSIDCEWTIFAFTMMWRMTWWMTW